MGNEMKDYERIILKKSFQNSEILSQVLIIVPDDFFKDELHDLFFKSMKFLFDGHQPVNMTSMIDVLKDSGNEDHIATFKSIVVANYQDEDDWKYHLNVLVTFYNRAKALRIAAKLQENAITWTTKQIHSYLESVKDEIVFSKKEVRHIKSIINEVQEEVVSDTIPYLVTGNEKFDRIVTLSVNNILLLAGGKGSAKSRFTLFIIDRVLKMNENVSVMWLNFEMSSVTMVQLLVARRTGFTTKQISRKGHKLEEDDIKAINKAIEDISDYDMEFCSKPMTIGEIFNEFKKFCSHRKDKRNILVIDNLGLILSNANKNQIDVDEYIAKKIVQLREETGALIIPIHHLTKEQGVRTNIKNAYAPKIEDIRGSTRIPDYAKQVILIHKPSNFKDLVTQEELKGTYTNKAGVTINRAKVIKDLIILDVAKNRDDSQEYIRFTSNLGHCRFKEWEAK